MPIREEYVDRVTIDTIYKNGIIDVPPVLNGREDNGFTRPAERLLENEPVILKDYDNDSHSALCIRRNNKIVVVKDQKVGILSGMNAEQKVAIHMLLDDDIPVVTLSGKAGSGKTLLAVAAALEKSRLNVYSRILVGRPNVALEDGDDFGFTPGTLDEKMAPWMEPIFDNLRVLGFHKIDRKELQDKQHLELVPLPYIRGRSLVKTFVIIDESQNLTREAIRTISTRLGNGSKLVLTGDTDQVDKRNLRDGKDGLTWFIERTKDQPLIGCVRLRQSVRSPICELLTELLA